MAERPYVPRRPKIGVGGDYEALDRYGYEMRRYADALERELAVLRADRERLDWLEAQKDAENGYAMPVWGDGRWWIYHNDDEKDKDAPTLRAALDAARRGDPEGGE